MTLCREIKHTLSGKRETYSCELLAREPGFGMLRYVVDREYGIAGHRLRPGDVTHALYWEDRPYTLYVWDLRDRGGRLFYFNLADSIALRRGEFAWRDLAIDVLIDAAGTISVLDEHELPHDLTPQLRLYIDRARDLIVASHREIIKEANERIRRLEDQFVPEDEEKKEGRPGPPSL